MSLSRLALRLAAYEALCPFAARAAKAGFPTLAGANVYDSRIDPIDAGDDWGQFLASIEGDPIVIVYTEPHDTEPTPGAEYPAEREFVDLVAEMMIASAGSVEVEQPDGSTTTVGTIAAPITDAQHEAILDVLEAQVRQVLSLTAPPSGPWLSVATELHHIRSVPQRSTDKTVRLAARTLTMRFRVASTRWAAPGSAVGAGLSALPPPLLTVALALAPASPHAQMLVALAALIAPPSALTPLTDIRINASLDRSAAPTNPAGTDSDIVADAPLTGA